LAFLYVSMLLAIFSAVSASDTDIPQLLAVKYQASFFLRGWDKERN